MDIKKFENLTDYEINELVKIELYFFKKYGKSFADKPWNSANFKLKLPNKEKLSYVLIEKNKIIGYCVASEKYNYIYIHRFACLNKFGNFLLKKLIESVYKLNIYLMVNIININAINFYKKFGFFILKNKKKIKEINNNFKINDAYEIIIEERYKCYMMEKN